MKILLDFYNNCPDSEFYQLGYITSIIYNNTISKTMSDGFDLLKSSTTDL